MRHGRLKESKQVGQPDTDKGLTRNNKEHKTVLPPTFTSLLSSNTESMNNGLWLLWLLQKVNKTSKIRKNFKSWITLRYKWEILLLAYFIILLSSLAWILWPSHLPHPHQGICADFFCAIEILTELGEQSRISMTLSDSAYSAHISFLLLNMLILPDGASLSPQGQSEEKGVVSLAFRTYGHINTSCEHLNEDKMEMLLCVSINPKIFGLLQI